MGPREKLHQQLVKRQIAENSLSSHHTTVRKENAFHIYCPPPKPVCVSPEQVSLGLEALSLGLGESFEHCVCGSFGLFVSLGLYVVLRLLSSADS